jgi:hypothetical protein
MGKLWDLNFGGNERPHFKICMGKAGLNLRRYQKTSTDPSDVGTVAFDEYCRFDTYAFF